MSRHQYSGDALIEVLHTAQELYGFLSPELLKTIAQQAAPAAQPRARRGQLLSFLFSQA